MNTPSAMPQDRAALMQVIEQETDTFVSRDFKGWADCWVQDARTRNVCVSSSFGATVLEGWEPLKQYMQTAFESGSTCEIVHFQRINHIIMVSGDIAHVVFDGRSTHVDGRIEQTFETRTLERREGAWRILYASFVLRGHQQIDANRLAVDAEGKVLCAPADAIELLKAHPGLQLSNGRLRASRPAWDKSLQAGLKCAAEQHGYFQHYRYATQNGRDFRLPIVLGETDEGSVVICVLFVRDGMTFVETRSDGNLDVRLNVAKAIFGLSDGQMRLVRRIVTGDSLTMAAAALGISINTARTHLSRVYGKTGINSPTALVRTLLSVG